MKSKIILHDNRKLAEFVGIMLGDGYFSYFKNPRIKISFNSISDKDYIEYVRDLIFDVFAVRPIVKHRSNENTSELYLFKKKVLDIVLYDVQLKPSPKWGTAIIPDWIYKSHLTKYVLRGYFDTDGCVVVTNNNGITYPRLEMKICPSPMQDGFINILSSFGFRFGVYSIGKGKVRVQINGKVELDRWIQKIGFSNQKHMGKSVKFFS